MFTLDEDDEDAENGETYKNYQRPNKLEYINKLEGSESSSDDNLTPA